MRKNFNKANRKGQVVGMVSDNVLSIMLLIFMVFAVLYGIATLKPSSFFTAGSIEANATSKLQQNLTTGVGSFGDYIPTGFQVMGVVFVLAFIAILIVYVVRMKNVGSTGGGL